MGVWIEIYLRLSDIKLKQWSLPAWECGLKYVVSSKEGMDTSVPPCVGVWIEIGAKSLGDVITQSLPAWECGLKWLLSLHFPLLLLRHSLRGSVD